MTQLRMNGRLAAFFKIPGDESARQHEGDNPARHRKNRHDTAIDVASQIADGYTDVFSPVHRGTLSLSC